MEIMHWLTGHIPGPQTADPSRPEDDFHDIALLLESYLKENTTLQRKLQDAEGRLVDAERSRKDLVYTQSKYTAEVSRLNKTMKGAARLVEEANRERNNEERVRKRFETEAIELRKQLSQLKRNQHCEDQENALVTALESLGKGPMMPLVPQQFVVVLVDGDAYTWADDLRATEDLGAQVATRIQHRITRFLIKSKLGSCKAVVRIYRNCNASRVPQMSLLSHLGCKTHAQSVLAFNQTVPLFDYVDVGHGKERADVKIRENLDLFLANARCQHIFLAACRDSGFARMLEPYRYHTIASKITLVANGYIAPDIARLGWWTTTWPDVFGERANRTPLAEQKKRAAIAQVEQARCRQLGLVGILNERLAQSILEVVRPAVKVSGRGFESFGLGVDLMSKALKGMPSEASPGIVKLVDDID